jgi:hypothetical protein
MNQGSIAQLAGVPVCALGLLILYAGVSKYFYLKEFRSALLFVPHVPLALIPAISVGVPALEILSGLSLVFGHAWGVALTVALLLAMSLVAFVAHYRKQRVPCVCFTASASEDLSISTVKRNGVFAVIALLPVLTEVSTFGTSPLVLPSGIAMIFLYLCVELVIRNSHMIASIGRSS